MRCPSGLKPYADAEAAKGAMLREQGKSGQPLEVYRCGRCYEWHVGKLIVPGRERP